MPFVAPSDTITLHPPAELGFGPDEYITIKRQQTAGMRQRIMRRALAVNIGAAEPTTDIDIFAWRTALLEEIVVAWSDPEPVSPVSLAAMTPDVQDWIAAEFDAASAGRSEAEKNASGGNSSDGLLQPATPSNGSGLPSLATSSNSGN